MMIGNYITMPFVPIFYYTHRVMEAMPGGEAQDRIKVAAALALLLAFVTLVLFFVASGLPNRFMGPWFGRWLMLAFTLIWPQVFQLRIRQTMMITMVGLLTFEGACALIVFFQPSACGSCVKTVVNDPGEALVAFFSSFLVIPVLVFFMAYLQEQVVRKEFVELTMTKEQLVAVERSMKKLGALNAKIKDELEMHRLNKDQVKLIESKTDGLRTELSTDFEVQWDELEFIKIVGSGAFADCYEGTFNGESVAIKHMRNGLVNEEGLAAFEKEALMLSTLHHPNIVKLIGFCLDPSLCTVMSFANSGTLSDLIKQAKSAFDAAKAQWTASSILSQMPRFLYQIATALAYLHDQDPRPILHRDIKADNILLHATVKGDPNTTKALLADLGEARFRNTNGKMTKVGTPGYVAPEILAGLPYSVAADIFSFGIVMCEACTLQERYGEFRENGKSWDALNVDIVQNGLRPRIDGCEVAPAVADLIKRCWIRDPSLRPTAADLVEELEHFAARMKPLKFAEGGKMTDKSAKQVRKVIGDFVRSLWRIHGRSSQRGRSSKSGSLRSSQSGGLLPLSAKSQDSSRARRQNRSKERKVFQDLLVHFEGNTHVESWLRKIRDPVVKSLAIM